MYRTSGFRTSALHSGLLGGLAALLLACGASAPSPSTTANAADGTEPGAAQSDAGPWSASLLRRLDPDLRSHVRRGTTQRLAIKVYFRESPSDDELSALLLSRVGRQVVGNVRLATLQRIAARDDVDRIESINDAGY